MSSLIYKWELLGIFIIFFLGAIIHEAYRLSGYNNIVALFAPVNESVWEHLKMAVTAILLFSLIESFFIPEVNNFILAKTCSIYLVPILITGMHYFYKQLIGSHNLTLDLLVFLIAIAAGQLVSYGLLISSKHYTKLTTLALAADFIIVLLFVYATFNPPKIPIFKDGPTGLYGMPLKK